MRLFSMTRPLLQTSISSRVWVPQVKIQRNHYSQRGPKASTFKPNSTKKEMNKSKNGEEEIDSKNLTKLKQDAPMHLKKQAIEMYESCRLSNRDSITRFAIVRQMRNLDLPPHREVWQGINASDELKLYQWVNEAFGQLLYTKKLWKPCLDWTPEDDQNELELNLENYKLLQRAYQDQIVSPLKEKFGDNEVTIALSNLRDDQKLYIKPAIIWRSMDKEGDMSLEWMSQVTADVIWPGLVSCLPDYHVARRYWESEAINFSKLMGGVPCGMGPNGETLPPDLEMEELSTQSSQDDENPYQFQPSFIHSSHDQQRLAEAVLIKKFLQEQNSSM